MPIKNRKRALKEIFQDVRMGIKVKPSDIRRLENYAEKIHKSNWIKYDKIQEALTYYAIKNGE